MPISANDIVWRPSKLTSNTTPAQNGGGCDFAQIITTNVKNNVFPDVTQADRLAGSDKYRKLFLHVKSNDNLQLVNGKVFIDAFTAGGDAVLLYSTTNSSVETGVGTHAHGIGTLKDDVAAGVTSLNITVENPDLYSTVNPFQTDDWLYVRSGSTEDFATITGRTVNVDGSETITFSPALTNAYVAGSTLVSSAIFKHVSATLGTYTTNSPLGVVNAAPIVLNNRGAIDETWTLTFTSASTYTVAGATVGSLGTGSTASSFDAVNSTASANYFSIPVTCFTGQTFQTGDTFVFDTVSATIPVWIRRKVPVGTAAFINNAIALGVIGES